VFWIISVYFNIRNTLPCIGFWCGNLREREHLEDADGRIILKCIFRKWDVGVWTGSSWLMIGTGGRHL